jgi:chromosome partitioning protein
MEILAVFNAKGGVGKTTTAVNLAACLAATGLRVVLFDLDSQGNATSNIGLPKPPEHGTFEVISGQVAMADALAPTLIEGLSVIGATRTLSASDLDLAAGPTEHGVIRAVAKPLAERIDVIVLDCPPTFGAMTTNALLSADAVLIPSQPDPFAHDGLVRTWTVLKRVRTKLNRDLKILGVLPTFVAGDDDPAKTEHQAVLDAMTAEFGDMVDPAGVPMDAALFARATADGLPAVIVRPDAPASVAYLMTALRLLGRGATREAGEQPRLLHRFAGSPTPDGGAVESALAALTRFRGKAAEAGLIDTAANVPSVDAAAIRQQAAIERERAAKAHDSETDDGGGASSGRGVFVFAVLGAAGLAATVAFAAGWILAGGGFAL